jgi:hypothetical protein
MGIMEVNYYAVLVCGILMFVLGGLWYSPALFAKRWMQLIGKTEEELKKVSNATIYVRGFILGLMSSYVLGSIINFAGAATVETGAMVGFICWAGFHGAPTYNGEVNFMQRPVALWAINSGYVLVSFVSSGVILALWK